MNAVSTAESTAPASTSRTRPPPDPADPIAWTSRPAISAPGSVHHMVSTIKVPCDKQVPGLLAQPGAGGGHMGTGQVAQAWNHYGNSLKGLMAWSLNRDGPKGWMFGDNVTAVQGC